MVEVREGQLTDSFAKFPYDEVKSQSFSFIFEEERKIVVHMHSYMISKIYRTHMYQDLRMAIVVDLE